MTTAIAAVTLADLFDAAALDEAIAGGYVRRQFHPTEALAILNYTEKTAYEAAWDSVTLTCRGLVYSTDTFEVVARPFAKFFNHGQAGAPLIGLGAPVAVHDKLDGSLGIVFPLPAGGWAVATRGSFASEQAIHATDVYRSRYADRFTPPAGRTVLVEIVYPANRIVVDNGDFDDLVLLGAVDVATGEVFDPGAVDGWPGPTAQAFHAPTFADALALPPRPNAEGIVVRCLVTGTLLKLKQADYVALHRIVTGLNARTVWQHLVDEKPLDDLIAPLPDEFRTWVESVAADIQSAVQQEVWRLEDAYTAIRDGMPDDWRAGDRESRAVFARQAVQHPDKWALFALLDGKDIRPELLKRAKPDACVTPSGRMFGEDTA